MPGPVTIQNSYSLVSRSVDNDLAEVLYRERMSLLAYSPLAAGMLSGKYMGGARPPEARLTLFDGMGMRFRKPIVHEAIEAYAALAARRGMSLVQLALGFVRSRWFLGAAIIGATSLDQLAGGHRRRASGTRCRDAGGNRGDPDPVSQSGPACILHGPAATSNR